MTFFKFESIDFFIGSIKFAYPIDNHRFQPRIVWFNQS